MNATGEFWPTVPLCGRAGRAPRGYAGPTTTPPAPPDQEPFDIGTDVKGVREWRNPPQEMGFVYRVQPDPAYLRHQRRPDVRAAAATARRLLTA